MQRSSPFDSENFEQQLEVAYHLQHEALLSKPAGSRTLLTAKAGDLRMDGCTETKMDVNRGVDMNGMSVG